MRTEDVLWSLVACGVIVTCLYLMQEFLQWRWLKNFDVKARLELRELYRRLHTTAKPRFIRAIRKK